MPIRRRAPLWFLLLVAAALGVAGRVCLQEHGVAHATDLEHGRPLVAFWFFVVFVAELVWRGLEVAARVTLAIVHWMVLALYRIVAVLGNGLSAAGHAILQGLKRTWDFFKLAYEDVIKPGVLKLWSWFLKFKDWLDDTFRPVLDFLKTVRDTVLCFYKTWIRPWLDLIDVTRKALRILAGLGFDWAKALDARLGKIESLIERPFRLVLAKINEVINIVNRVVTLDGLIQRVALLRSLERDYIFAWRSATNPWHRLFSEDEQTETKRQQQGKPFAKVVIDTQAYMRDRSGPNAPLLDEMTIIWRNYLVRR